MLTAQFDDARQVVVVLESMKVTNRVDHSVRQATPDDIQAILDCLRLAFEPYRDDYTPEGFADTTLTPETLAARMNTMTVLVAVNLSSGIAGTIALGVINEGEGHLRGMAVRPEWQGHGIATLLLSAAEAQLRGRNCRRITLDTTAPLGRAIDFYEKQGYRRSGKVGHFFGMPLFEYEKAVSSLKNEASDPLLSS
jgi:ribosomal protein S18 acetylase RimI-like enzyme